jgi:hypothetical protein
MSQGGWLLSGDALHRAAFDAGEKIWKAYPARRRQILLDYGYTKVELKGTLVSGFEIIGFTEFPKKAARSESGAIGINMEIPWTQCGSWVLYMTGCKANIGFRSRQQNTGFHGSREMNARISAWRSPWGS